MRAQEDQGRGTTATADVRLREIQERTAAAAARVGRSSAAVTLVAVSKGFRVSDIQAARAAGQVDFGESRAQELRDKVRELGAPGTDPGTDFGAASGAGTVRWHFVGRVQRNKVRDLVGVVSLIHSVDRLELAREIADHARRGGRVQRVLVQVNAGGDPDKAGCAPGEALGLVARVRALPGVACEGLMTIPPFDADPRPVFRRLRVLRDEARERFPEVQHLSMGMTRDFEEAVEEGATIVRIGEGVFGARPEGRGG